jgi:hypothetical protein
MPLETSDRTNGKALIRSAAHVIRLLSDLIRERSGILRTDGRTDVAWSRGVLRELQKRP